MRMSSKIARLAVRVLPIVGICSRSIIVCTEVAVVDATRPIGVVLIFPVIVIVVDLDVDVAVVLVSLVV